LAEPQRIASLLAQLHLRRGLVEADDLFLGKSLSANFAFKPSILFLFYDHKSSTSAAIYKSLKLLLAEHLISPTSIY